MAKLQQENAQVWFDEDLIEDPGRDIFNIDYWQAQNKVIGQAKGRGITWFVQTQNLAAALRHYHRGGFLEKLVEDSFFFTGFEQTRPAKEFAILQYLATNGFPSPRPIAARAVKFGLSYSADILVEKINGARDLVAILKSEALSAEKYSQIGAVICQMHHLQVCHSDLNIHNILLDDQGKIWLIDFDKCDRRSGNLWKQKNLKRLYRSFNKEKEKEQIHWQKEDWQPLVLGYMKALNSLSSK